MHAKMKGAGLATQKRLNQVHLALAYGLSLIDLFDVVLGKPCIFEYPLEVHSNALIRYKCLKRVNKQF